jgi:hypothetical protein
LGIGGDVTGEGHAAVDFVDRVGSADDGGAAIARRHEQGETKSGERERGGFGAEVVFVELKGGLAVELVEDGAFGAGDGAFEAEGDPAAAAAEADGEVTAIEPDGDDASGGRKVVQADECFLKSCAVARESAADGDAGREIAIEGEGELAAVAELAVGENENVNEVGSDELFREFFAGGETFLAFHDVDGGDGDGGFFESDRGDGKRGVEDFGAGDFAAAGDEHEA